MEENVMSKTRAALYLRVSTEEQKREGFSLAAQEEILRGYCKAKGFQFYEVYDDGGYSGKDFNRPRMQQLLRDLREDRFDIVLAVAVDRISRNNLDVLTFVEKELHPRGKKLIISTCDIDSSTETGKMFISLLGTFAEYERRLIISRVKKGMDKRASEGKWNGGMMLGYDSVDGKLMINDEEAEIVKEIFELRASGRGYKFIAGLLNSKGKKTKGTDRKPSSSFSVNGVKTILENEKYTGHMTWGKLRDWNNKRRKGKTEPIKIENSHEAIIDSKLWDKVQGVRRIKSESLISESNFKGEFVLSGLLRCPACGAGTVMSKSMKRDGSGYYLYYMCQNYHAKGKTVCSSNLIRKELIEEQVLIFIRTMLGSEEIVDGIMERLIFKDAQSTNQLEKDLNIQRLSLKKLLNRQNKQDDDYYSGKIKAERYDRLAETLEAQITETKQAILYIEREMEKTQNSVIISKEVIFEALTNFDNLFAVATNEEKRSLLRALIKEIHVETDRKNIKNIVFWFTEDDQDSNNALPLCEERRTVPQVKIKTFWNREYNNGIISS
jgi:site-specific DNA recombinase